MEKHKELPAHADAIIQRDMYLAGEVPLALERKVWNIVEIGPHEWIGQFQQSRSTRWCYSAVGWYAWFQIPASNPLIYAYNLKKDQELWAAEGYRDREYRRPVCYGDTICTGRNQWGTVTAVTQDWLGLLMRPGSATRSQGSPARFKRPEGSDIMEFDISLPYLNVRVVWDRYARRRHHA